MSHFPGVDRQEVIIRAWPRAFGEPVGPTYPLTIVESTLVVLCQTEGLVRRIEAERRQIVRRLDPLLEGEPKVVDAEGVIATRTEIYLAQELFWLKLWLRDFDLGF